MAYLIVILILFTSRDRSIPRNVEPYCEVSEVRSLMSLIANEALFNVYRITDQGQSGRRTDRWACLRFFTGRFKYLVGPLVCQHVRMLY